jgi:hypothetical protein
MRAFRHVIGIATVLAVATTGGMLAQEKRASPHETTKATIDGANISIEYGRPYKKGRQIFGGLEPWDKVWRTGADEATTFTTDKAIQIGNLPVPAGKYTLYTIPSQTDWKLIVNKQTGQWGTQYDEKQDLGRVSLKKTTLTTPVEQLTIAIEKAAAGGQLKISWDDTELTAPITVQK